VAALADVRHHQPQIRRDEPITRALSAAADPWRAWVGVRLPALNGSPQLDFFRWREERYSPNGV
jgi:hypothetical protein